MDQDIKKHLLTLLKVTTLVLFLILFYAAAKYVLPLAGKIIYVTLKVLLPFIIAVLLALLIEPLVTYLQDKIKMSRSWSVFISLLAVYGGIGGLLVAVVTRIAREMAGLYQLANERSGDIVFSLTKLLNDIQLFYLRLNLPPDVQQSITSAFATGLNEIQKLLSSSASGLIGVLIKLPNFFILLLIIAVATFFISRDRQMIRHYIFKVIPSQQKSKMSSLINDLMKTFIGFVKAEAILVSVTGLQIIVGLRILGVDYALTIGLICGLFDILPVLGPGTILMPWALWELLTGHIGFGIGILVVYFVAAAVRQILEPRILGDNIGLHPLITLLALYVGLKLGGVVGMILGPVAVVVILSMIRAGVFDDIKWFNRA